MNIRHRTTGEEFELIDKYGQEWTVYDAKGERRLFKKDKLVEITPDPQWVDVTSACDVYIGATYSSSEQYIHPRHDGYAITHTDYRLRKVQGVDVLPSHFAFAVERKKL